MYWIASTSALLLLMVIAYIYWKPWIRPNVKATPVGEATLHFFYTDWCGHSKKAMPEWEQFKATLPATYGTTKVTAKAVDCEKDVTTCTAYGVEGYPTVKLESSEGVTDFKQRVTASSLEAFLVSTLGEKA